MATTSQSMGLSKKGGIGKKKRVPKLAKCGRGGGGGGGAVEVDGYQKSFLLRLTTRDSHMRWFKLNLSSTTDEAKEAEETSTLQIPSTLTGVHLSFHHDHRHQGPNENNPQPALPLVAELLAKHVGDVSYRLLGSSHAAVGTTLYSFGGFRLKQSSKWYRNTKCFDTGNPDQGWKKGPRTVCGRQRAATVSLDGKIYVFGGCRANDCWAEFFDATVGGGGVWSPMESKPPAGLGYEDLFGSAFGGGQNGAAQTILVGSKRTGRLYSYNVSTKIWNDLGSVSFGCRFFTEPIAVGSKVLWISFASKQMFVFDCEDKTVSKLPIGDAKICEELGVSMDLRGYMNPNLLHLAGHDVFCLVWAGDGNCLHCTTLRLVASTTVYVMCCHRYEIERGTRLITCVR